MKITADNPNLIHLLIEQSKRLIEEKKIILSRIEPWLTKLEESDYSKLDRIQKQKEIIDIGNFIYYFDSSLEIDNALYECPDIILKKDELRIGVELKDLVIRHSEKEKEGIFKSLFDQIILELESEKGEFNGLYRIELFDENISLKRQNKEAIKKEIIALIKGFEFEKRYIKQIKKRPFSGISLDKGQTTIVGDLKKEVVEENILSKEDKLRNYSKNNLDEIWLLFIIPGVKKSSAYSSFDPKILEETFKSNFDRIFIYDFFHRKTTELKLRRTTMYNVHNVGLKKKLNRS